MAEVVKSSTCSIVLVFWKTRTPSIILFPRAKSLTDSGSDTRGTPYLVWRPQPPVDSATNAYPYACDFRVRHSTMDRSKCLRAHANPLTRCQAVSPRCACAFSLHGGVRLYLDRSRSFRPPQHRWLQDLWGNFANGLTCCTREDLGEPLGGPTVRSLVKLCSFLS